VQVTVDGELRRYTVRSTAVHRLGLRVGLDEIETRERADELSGADVYVSRTALPQVGADEYYDFEVLGWEVVTRQEAPERSDRTSHSEGAMAGLGRIDEILVPGANDVYVVRQDGDEILVPVTRHAVLKIDRERRRILVEPSALVYPDARDRDR